MVIGSWLWSSGHDHGHKVTRDGHQVIVMIAESY